MHVGEHLASKRRGPASSPLGRREVDVHGVKYMIWAAEEEIAPGKALEALWFFTKKNQQ